MTFVQASRELDNAHVGRLRTELEAFVNFGELYSWLLLAFLWRGIVGLDAEHHSHVRQLLVASGVIFMLETDGTENTAIAIAPYRLPSKPDEQQRNRAWPLRLRRRTWWPMPLQDVEPVRELVLKFDLYVGCPYGLTERFASDTHRLGTVLLDYWCCREKP